MSVKRFGPVQGAGVSLKELEGEKTIEPSPLGVTAFISEFVKGTVGEPTFPSGLNDFHIRHGDRLMQNSEGPQSAKDFYKLGNGAGELIVYRVTAGDEKQAEMELWTRQGTASTANDSGRKFLGYLRAKNGGQWGGQRQTYLDDLDSGASDLTETTFDTGDTMIENQWKGGTVQFKKIGTKTYKITGNTAAGVVSVEADQTLLTDFNAGSGTPANRYKMTLDNVDYNGDDQHLAIVIKDGEENPSTEFKLEIYEDGAIARTYANLNCDPTKPNYWVNVINDDIGNQWIFAVDSYSGDKTVAAVRPANFYGLSKTLTATTLTLPDPDVTVNSPGGADPTVTINSLGSLIESQTITGTVQATVTTIKWTTTLGPLEQEVTTFTGVATDLGDEQLDITVTNGGTALAEGDTIVVQVQALVPSEAVGGKVWPDKVNYPNYSLPITANTRTTISVRSGQDLTNDANIAAGEVFSLEYQQEMGLGYDSSPVTDAQYLDALDTVSSKLNRIFGKNKGLVKIATPGITSSVVQKAGLTYSESRNYQYCVTVPANITSESDVIDYINTTIGRNEHGFVHWPSFGKVYDPDAPTGQQVVPLKQIALVGQILGRHAKVAREYNGYHKAPAGIDVTLPDVLEMPTGNAETQNELNEEILNPAGINILKFRDGIVVMMGDRTMSSNPTWKFLHARSYMSYVENILRENFDWIVYKLNNKREQNRVETSLRGYFYPEWVKGALDGDKFSDAFTLKIDEENNTDITRSTGDMNAEMALKIVDTIERLNITIDKKGIFDSVSAT